MITLYNADGTTFMTLAVDDSTNRQRELMGQDVLTMVFSINSFVEIPVGCYCIMPDVFAAELDEQGATNAGLRVDLSRYTMYRKAQVTKVNEREYEYTLKLYSPSYIASLRKFRNVVINYSTSAIGGDNRLKFSLTATPKEHLQMVVDNLNKEAVANGDTPEWSIGGCIDYDTMTGVDSGTEKLVSYDSLYIDEALAQMADVFETEYYFHDKRVFLQPCEYLKAEPVIMSYGRANGFLSGLARQGEGDRPPIGRLFAEGGERNINPSEYGKYQYHRAGGMEWRTQISDTPSRVLLLPYKGEIWYDGTTFYDSAHTGARHYIVSADRLSIVNADNATYDSEEEVWIENTDLVEDSLDCSEIYPKRVGTLARVETEDAEHNLIDIYDGALSTDAFFDRLDNITIGGDKPVIVFQSGNLAGREFDLHCSDNNGTIAVSYVTNKGWKLQPVPAQIDGVWMPGGNPEDNYTPSVGGGELSSVGTYTLNDAYMPAAGDQYAIFGIEMPWTYLDDGNHNGAEWEMFKKVAKYMYENEQEAYDFKGDVDTIWARQRWSTQFTQPDGTVIEHGVGGYFRPGYHIFLDDSIIPNGMLLRITGVTDYPNKPYSPRITLTNIKYKTRFLTRFNGVAGAVVSIRQNDVFITNRSNNRMRDINETSLVAKATADSAEETAGNAFDAVATKVDKTDVNSVISKLNEVIEHANDDRTLFLTLSSAISDWNSKQSRENRIDWVACIDPEDPDEIDTREGATCKDYKKITPMTPINTNNNSNS